MNVIFSSLLFREIKIKEFKKKRIPEFFGYCEKQLKSSPYKSGFLFQELCYADLCMFHIIDMIKSIYPDVVQKFPQLDAFHLQIESRPNISNYRKKSEGRKKFILFISKYK